MQLSREDGADISVISPMKEVVAYKKRQWASTTLDPTKIKFVLKRQQDKKSGVREKRKSIGDKENIDLTNTPKSAVKIEDKSCNSINRG